MSEVVDAARDVRAGEEVDVEKLQSFLAAKVPELANLPLEVKQFPGGHSNLTYLEFHTAGAPLRAAGEFHTAGAPLRAAGELGDRELVMRRPPFGTKVKSAHDMGREFRILSALAGSYAHAPKPVVYSDDPSVMGAPFYVMERLRGIILRKELPPSLGLDPARFRKLCENLVDALVDLHALDYKAIGLDNLGKPEGYVQRQVEGWTDRYKKSQTDDVPVVEQVAKWLEEHRPADSGASLIHNDFKFDNVVLDPNDPTRILGILDWEMSTIGDPLMDLGTFISYWVEAADDPMMQLLRGGPSEQPGALTRAEIVERYEARSGRKVPNPSFYYVFGLFKTAVVIQQIYYRYRQGLTKDERFSVFGIGVQALCDQAARSIDKQS